MSSQFTNPDFRSVLSPSYNLSFPSTFVFTLTTANRFPSHWFRFTIVGIYIKLPQSVRALRFTMSAQMFRQRFKLFFFPDYESFSLTMSQNFVSSNAFVSKVVLVIGKNVSNESVGHILVGISIFRISGYCCKVNGPIIDHLSPACR